MVMVGVITLDNGSSLVLQRRIGSSGVSRDLLLAIGSGTWQGHRSCHQDSNPSLGIFFVKTSIFSDLLWIDSADTVKVCRTWSGLNSPKINFCAGTSWIKHRVSPCITPEVVASSHGLIDSERPVGSCCGSSWSSVLIRVFFSASLLISKVKIF